MTEILNRFFFYLLDLLKDLGLWMALGFVVAGLVQEFIPAKALLRYFGQNDWKSLGRASLAGLAVSVCSCGAIPLAVTLRKKGAATATALTFLLATPWAGFIQLFILNGFLGAKATFLVFTFAIVVAFVTGLILARLETFGWLDQKLLPQLILEQEVKRETGSLHSFFSRLKKSFYYSLDAFKEMAKYLGIGIVLATLVQTLVPVSWVERFLGLKNSFDPILVAIPFSAVLELCSEGFSIFAGNLYQMGATLGVVFVMMMVGVTTDFTELSVIWGKFGKRSTWAYLITATIVAFSMAHLVDWVWKII